MNYLFFLLLLLPLLALSAWASAKVNAAFAAYDDVPNSSHMTGYDTAVRLLSRHGMTGSIQVNRVRGRLSDHYDPTKGLVNLSVSTYGSASVAAVAVAAHEVGHVLQKKQGYLPYRIRTALVPVANLGSRIALPLILLGILLDIFVFSLTGSVAGQCMMYVGIALYSASTLFMLVTLPVEFNASSRAKKMLVEEGILTQEELPGAKKVLSAAAMTYVASLLISLVYFLRFFLFVFSYLRSRNG